MEERPEKSEQTEELSVVKRVEHARVTMPRRSRTRVVIIVALFAAACVVLLFWWLNRSGGNSGRVVTAPRAVTFDQPEAGAPASGTTAAPGEATLTVAPDVAARAGIKVEAVGEQLAPEALQQAATGVVQANAYRSTPVMSLVGGRLLSVAAEAGQEVRRGQTLAVVFSDELASAQTRYLSAQAEL
ncbi:MAG: efflux RND transporter periplasmic adaptor subunit, partial [Pyrinomonadaceae bacterium]